MADNDHSPPQAPTTPPDTDDASKQQRFEKHQAALQSWDSFEACASPGSARQMLGRSKKRKHDSLFGSLRPWIVQHQIGLSLNLLALLILTHISFPRARRRTRHFFELSYYNSSTGRYEQGPDDLLFVAYWIVVFTGLRAAVMTYLLLPLAQQVGISKDKTKVRFAEQAWLLLYYSISWTAGMYIMYNSKYWFNFQELWTNFPTRSMEWLHKWYYLVQFAFWVQQILVVNIEERRKDHWQMFTHHIITCALMSTSYCFYQTKVGNVILCVMDVVDLIFPLAKMLKYAGYQTACDLAFGIFIITYFVTRHILYPRICWSIYKELPKLMHYGCYDSVSGVRLSSNGGSEILSNLFMSISNPGEPVCFNPRIQFSFLAMLLFLQGILLLWFGMIVRVAWNVLKGAGADDSRSDDEGDAEVDDEDLELDDGRETRPGIAATGNNEVRPLLPLEQTVGVEGLNLRQRRHRSNSRYRNSRKTGSHTVGLSLAGHGDRKELLGRIGCDKPS